MKKLMTMLAAAAMAFGLYADPFADNWSAATATDLTGWSGATDKAKLEGGVLKIATGSDLLSRSVTPFPVSENFYFDTSLDMLGQALDEVPTVDATAKLALFVLDSSEIEGAPKATNFYAIAENPTQDGKWLYELGVDLEDVNAGARFTVKAYKNVLATGERMGFKLFLNGDEAEGTADLVKVVGAYPIEDDAVVWSTYYSRTDLENAYLKNLVAPTLKKDHRAVLLSLQETVGSATVSSMDFAGNAEISTVNFNDSGYNFIASDADVMTIASLTDGLTIVDVKVDDESVLSGDVITAEDGDMLTVTLEGSFDIVEWSLNGETQEVEDNTFEVDFEKDGVITVSGSAAGAEIGGKKFKTLKAALSALEASEAVGEIKLLTPADLDADLTIAVSADATIDLNGKMITGAGKAGEGNAVIVVNGGALTIKDSSNAQTGRILPVTESGADAVNIADGTLVVEGGIFDGAIVGATATTAVIKGGKFKSADGSAFYLAACMDGNTYKATYVEPYWTVEKITFVTATFYVDGVQHDTQQVESGKAPTAPAVPTKVGYTFTGWYPEIGEITENTDYNAVFAKNVAAVNDTPYTSLKTAIESAKAGETITVLCDCTNTETAVFYNTGTNAADQITFVNNYTVTLDTKDNYSIYIVNANVRMMGTGTFFKPSGAASAIVVGSHKDAGSSGRPAELGWGILDFEGNLTGGTDHGADYTYADAPSNMIKVEAGFGNFVGGSVVNYRSKDTSGRCVCASANTNEQGEVEYVGSVTIQSGEFFANDPLKVEANGLAEGVLKIVGQNNTAKVKPLKDETVLNYASFCEPGYTFVKQTEGQDAGWYKVGINTFTITVTDGLEPAATGTVSPANFNVESKFPLAVTLTKPTAPEGKKFKDWSSNYGTITENTLNITEFPNENVIVTVEWESAGPAPIDPDKPSDPIAAETAEDAIEAVQVARPAAVDDSIVSAEAYDKYFVKTAKEDFEGSKTWIVTATLAPEIVKAEDETEEVLAEVLDLTVAGPIEIKSAKPGLYYSLKQGEELGDRTESARVLAETTTVELNAGKWTNSGFYQVLVNTKAK